MYFFLFIVVLCLSLLDSPSSRLSQTSSVFFGSQELSRDCSFIKPLASTPGNKTLPIGETFFPPLMCLYFLLSHATWSICPSLVNVWVTQISHIHPDTHFSSTPTFPQASSHQCCWMCCLATDSIRQMEWRPTVQPRLTAALLGYKHKQTHASACMNVQGPSARNDQ